jgi:hypothetical protein
MESGCILWTVDEISGKWMKTAISSEADEKNSMSDGVARRKARRSDQGGPHYLLGEQGRRTPRRVSNGGWTSARRRRISARQRAHECPTEGGSIPTEGAMNAQWRAGLKGWPNSGSRGWPDGGLYKSCWPTFLGTLLQRLVSPARNAGT